MTAAALVVELRARGVTLVADGGTLRCQPKSALSAADLTALKELKLEILATLRRPVKSITCHSCRGRRFWISVYGVTVCATCHPPADETLVARWVEPSSEGRTR